MSGLRGLYKSLPLQVCRLQPDNVKTNELNLSHTHSGLVCHTTHTDCWEQNINLISLSHTPALFATPLIHTAENKVSAFAVVFVGLEQADFVNREERSRMEKGWEKVEFVDREEEPGGDGPGGEGLGVCGPGGEGPGGEGLGVCGPGGEGLGGEGPGGE